MKDGGRSGEGQWKDRRNKTEAIRWKHRMKVMEAQKGDGRTEERYKDRRIKKKGQKKDDGKKMMEEKKPAEGKREGIEERRLKGKKDDGSEKLRKTPHFSQCKKSPLARCLCDVRTHCCQMAEFSAK
jgi:hypothetical protein